MKKIRCLIALLIVPLAWRISAGQEIGGDLASQQPQIRIESLPVTVLSKQLDGSLLSGMSSRQVIIFPGWETLDFLGNDNIRAELDLSDSQNDVVEELVKEGERLREAALLENLKLKRISPEVINQFEKLSDELEPVLLEHQKKRLKELQFRCVLRQVGILPALISNQYYLKDFQLTGEQIVKLADVCKQIVEEKTPAVRELGDKAANEITKILDKDQRKTLEEMFGEDFMQRGVSLDLFLLQLGYDPESKENRAKPERVYGYEGMLSNPLININSGGSLEAGPERGEKLGLGLLLMVLQPEMVSSLELSDAQLEELESLETESRQRLTELSLLSEMSFEEMQKQAERAKQERPKVHAAVPKRINGILVPYQQERLKTICDLIGIRRVGVYGSLLDGMLSEKLKVTDAQKRDLQDAAKRVREETGNETIKIEAEIYEKIAEGLPKEKQERFREKLGKPIHKMPANLSTLLYQMEHPQF